MEPLEEITIKVTKPEDLPSTRDIESLPREVRLIVVFEEEVGIDKGELGEEWKTYFPEHLVGINSVENHISLQKLITVDEVKQHQMFFEKCGIEYARLASDLVGRFMTYFKVPPHQGFPFKTLYWFRNPHFKKSGKMGKWKYNFHGFHCGFTHQVTGLTIEASLVFGKNYGELDPYFFGQYIKTNPDYIPLPVPVYDSYHDGKRIVQTMLALGRFKEIKSHFEERVGVIPKNLDG